MILLNQVPISTAPTTLVTVPPGPLLSDAQQ